ncbi:MAG: NAD-dependent epimerase/dehydratase family protein [Limisphaerales bacterium]
MKTILLTGALGIVGRAIRPELAHYHDRIVVSDIQELAELGEKEEFEQGDLGDSDFLIRVTKEVDGIVHLGGLVGADYTFDELLKPNIEGAHNVFEAARVNGISRVVYASSAHVVGFKKRGEQIDHESFPRPNGEYAVSKALGEMEASFYADKFGLKVMAIRIGYVGDDLSKERRLRTWVSARDLVQLIEIGLNQDVGFEVVYGVSDNPEPFFDNANAFRLGYQPQDRSVDFVKDPAVLEQRPDLSSIEEGLVGGGFAAAGFEGDPKRIL